MIRPSSHARGLTLVELLVGLTVALIILSTALGVLHQMAGLRRRQEAQEQLGSTSAWLLGTLGRELRQAGLGRPKGVRAEAPSEPFPPAFLLADAQEVVFLADVPQPDTAFNGFSHLASDPFPGLGALGLLNELNGDCDVNSAVGACSTDATTAIFPQTATAGCSASTTARTCPWALGRYREDEYVLVVNGAGRWVQRRLDSPLHVTLGARTLLKLTTNLPAALLEGPNRGFVSTPDRVFYRLDTVLGELQRNQCWDSVGSPADAVVLATPCANAPDQGTGWEKLAAGVSALTFSYLDAQGNALPVPVPAASLPRVRSVRVTLQLQQSVAGTVLTHTDSITVTPRP